MLKRTTQCGWMALGATLFLLGVVLVVKLRDGNRAAAQSEPAPTSVGAVVGLVPTGLVLPSEPTQLKPVAGSTPLRPLASIFVEDPKVTPLPPSPPETAEPPTAPQPIKLVEFQFKDPVAVPVGLPAPLPPLAGVTPPATATENS